MIREQIMNFTSNKMGYILCYENFVNTLNKNNQILNNEKNKIDILISQHESLDNIYMDYEIKTNEYYYRYICLLIILFLLILLFIRFFIFNNNNQNGGSFTIKNIFNLFKIK